MDNYKELINLNEKLIKKFNLDYCFNNKKYDVCASIKALSNCNLILKSYYKLNDDLVLEDHVLKLYALLQGLFVGIDSLYALTYSLVKSKSFININNNKRLRELKYIRNDVVGHPSNRLIKDSIIAYAILDELSISDESFTYKIYTKDDIIVKDVLIGDLVKSYYEEANYLLGELFKTSNNIISQDSLKTKIINALDALIKGDNYQDYLNDFIIEYKNNYKAENNHNRIVWRYNLIQKLNSLNLKEQKVNEVINYAIRLEVIKIYEQITGIKFKEEYNFRLPDYIGNTYRFINRNKYLANYIGYLVNVENPLFLKTINLFKEEARNANNNIYKYFDLIIKYFYEDSEIAYALCLPIKNYRLK